MGAWTFECSVEAGVPPEFAWDFWTNIANWRELEPGAEFEIDGPFAEGTRGRTKMTGQETREWMICAVDPGRSWIQEIPLPGASFMVGMLFQAAPDLRTRITQRLWLEGDLANTYVDAVRMFETTTPAGLKRIAAAIEAAYRGAAESTR